jgi:hypothetical protein
MKPDAPELQFPDWNDIMNLDRLMGSPFNKMTNKAINEMSNGEMGLEDLFNYKDKIIDSIINV